MTKFVNRTEELSSLERWWTSSNSQLGMVWGRRRVGKTMLIQQFASARRTIFHTGAGRPPADELRLLSDAARAALPPRGTRDLATRPFASWDDALDWLSDQAVDAPLLLVLDEFPDLRAGSPELEGVLRAFSDRARDGRLRILLCGSAVRTMHALQEERSPLFGRFSLALHVRPFRPHEAALMLPRLTPAERAVVWGVLGGVPLYLSMWDQGDSTKANLQRLFCEPASPLLTEGDFLLATEGDLTGLGGFILNAIAAGRTKHNQIADAVGTDPSRVLARLIELQLVEQLVPVTEDAARTKRKSYRILDNYLSFWLGSVSRYRSQIERGLGKPIARLLETSLDDAMGQPWEAAFRSQIVRMIDAGSLPDDIIAVGPWWDTNSTVEIDAVGLAGRKREAVLFGEAKWARAEDGARLTRALQRKSESLGADVDASTYVVCARDELRDVPRGVIALTAKDIFRP